MMANLTRDLILLTGSSGQLSQEFLDMKVTGNIPNFDFAAPCEKEFDITDFNQVEALVTKLKPQIILNCAAYNNVDAAETDEVTAFKVNTEAVANLARICKKHNIFLVHYSSDYVFDGKKGTLYTEEDAPNPINKYGGSKLKGEEAIMQELKDFLIFRLSWVIGKGKQNFLYKLSEWAKSNPELKISADEISVPTFTQDIVNVTLLALNKRITGLYHLTNSGHCSRYELASYFIKKAGLNNSLVAVPKSTFALPAARPAFSAMSNAKISTKLGINIVKWESGVDRYLS